MKTNKTWKRYLIPPHQRGHRPKVSPDEPSAKYNIVLPKSVKEKLLKIGARKVRSFLIQMTEGVEDND